MQPNIKYTLPTRHEVQFTPTTRTLVGLEEIGDYLRVHRRTARRWILERALPSMQTPAGTWITTTSLIDLWIVAVSEARWDKQKSQQMGQARVRNEALTAELATDGQEHQGA